MRNSSTAQSIFRFLVKLTYICPILVAVLVIFPSRAFALPPPTQDEIQQYKKDGSLIARQRFALDLGNNLFDPYLIQSFKARLHLGTTNSTSPLPAFWTHGMPSTGNVKVPVIVIDFADGPYTLSLTSNDIKTRLFDPSKSDSLTSFYKTSSYNKLNISGDVLGIYREQHTFSYYQALANENSVAARQAMIKEALDYYDKNGADFSQYDSDNDGNIDSLYVLWAGTPAGWGSTWYTYQATWHDTVSACPLDGLKVLKYVFYSIDSYGDILTTVLDHETGHLLGIPDYYSYDMNHTSGAPLGGLGGFDIMDYNQADHNIFSKYLLGWVNPQIATQGSKSISLTSSATNPDGLIIMPNWNNPNSEYFFAEYLTPERNYSSSGITPGIRILHIDATLDSTGYDFLYDNSYTSHKFATLMEADGYQGIEHGNPFNDSDLYRNGSEFSPESFPNSDGYSGVYTGIDISNIFLNGNTATMDVGFVQSIVKPSVIRTYPANVSSIIGTDDALEITFSNTIYKAANFSRISLTDKDGKLVSTINTINNNILTVQPDQKLIGNSVYTLSVDAQAVKFSNGNTMSNAFVMQFSTANDAVDCWHPVVEIPEIAHMYADASTPGPGNTTIVAAECYDSSFSNYKTLLSKLDPNGGMLKYKIISTFSSDSIHSTSKVFLLPDGGLCIQSYGGIARLDSDWNVLWNKSMSIINSFPQADSNVAVFYMDQGKLYFSVYSPSGDCTYSKDLGQLYGYTVSKTSSGYLLESSTSSDGKITLTKLDKDANVVNNMTLTLPKPKGSLCNWIVFPDTQSDAFVRLFFEWDYNKISVAKVGWDMSIMDVSQILSNIEFNSIQCDDSGNLYAIASTNATVRNSRGIKVLKLLPDNSIEWSKNISYAGNIDGIGLSVSNERVSVIARTYVTETGIKHRFRSIDLASLKFNNAGLTSLSINGYDLYPQFNEKITDYKAYIPNADQTVTINAQPDNGCSIVSGTGSIGLAAGSNQLLIVVKDSSNNVTNYRILISRGSACTVTFDPQNGNNPYQFPYKSGDKLLRPTDPYRSGNTFGGWYKESTCQTKWNFDTDTIAGNMTLYAKWVPNSYTVKYSGNGGSGTMESSTFLCDNAAALRKNGFTRKGYAFAGWALSPNGAKVYDDCQSVLNLTTANNALVMLFAKWTVNSYTVVYDSNGGDGGAMNPSKFACGVSAPLAKNAFTKTCFNFSGWAKSPTGKSVYSNGQRVKNLSVVNGDTVTLYAVWTANVTSVYLSGITLSSGRLVPAFNPKICSYTVNLGEFEEGVTVTPAKVYANATMTIGGIAQPNTYVSATNGKSTKVEVKVSFGKLSRAYRLTIKRAKSTNNKLSSLSVSAGTLSPNFNADITNYSVTLPEDTARVTVAAAKSSSLASITNALKAYTLKNGQTIKAVVKVKAQSGATKTYTVLITRAKSTNADLAYVKTNSALCPITPAFNAGTVTGYTLTLPNSISGITVSFKAASPLSRVTVNGKACTSKKITLQAGQQIQLTIVVVSQAGTSKSYTIDIHRN